MKKGMTAWALALALLLCGTALAEKAPLTPGAYEATVTARNGDLTVRVTVAADAIEAVEVVSHSETVGVADAAIEGIPKDIVAAQSLNVDAYTGATITSRAIAYGVQKALEQAGGARADWNEPVTRRNTSDEVKELTADVVIVGAGAAGMSAAVSAAENGAESVVVVESLSTIGGNAMVSGGFLEYMDPPEAILPYNNPGYDAAVTALLEKDYSAEPQMKAWQDTVREQYAAYKESGSEYVFDSEELLAMQYHELRLGRPDETLIGYARKSHAVCEWFGEMGVDWARNQIIIGFPWPRWSYIPGAPGGSGYFAALERNIEENKLPVEILLETSATDLITGNGAVTGVVAKAVDGTTYRITGRKGVVLATGGFASNGEMLVKYNTQWQGMTKDVPSDNRQGTDGRGIEMALSVGAGTAIMDQYMLFPLGSPLDGSLTHGINGNFAMYVNREGRRFVDETLDRNTISQAIFNQDGGICYIIGDAENSGIVADGSLSGENLDYLLSTRSVFMADTLEELAAQVGMDPEVLTATVAAYNEAAESFSDPEFGRTGFEESCVIDKAPFFACPRTPTVHIILGGLTCAETGEVISTEGKPIPGLYAVGEITAGGAALSSFADGMMLGAHLFGK